VEPAEPHSEEEEPRPRKDAAKPVVEQVPHDPAGRPQSPILQRVPVPVRGIVDREEQREEDDLEGQRRGEEAPVRRGQELRGDEERYAIDPQNVAREDGEIHETHDQKYKSSPTERPPRLRQRLRVRIGHGPPRQERNADSGQDDENGG